MDLQQALVALGWCWNKLGHLMNDAEIISRAIWANRDL
jgi:hypothetical protein